MITNKKILITGGAGFIGSHLADAFLSLGNHVVILDDFSTGMRANLDKALANDKCTLVEGDIRDLKICQRLAEGCDYVLHSAAVGTVPRPVENYAETASVNVAGFVNVLTAAVEAGVKRFVYASSSSVYGDNADPVKTEDRIGKPITPYAVTKVCDELFAKKLSELYGIETIGLRYFNLFGPRQDAEGPYAAVIPRFIKALRAHESPVIFGDGSRSKDFTYVANAVNANILALEAGPEAVTQVFNIGCGEHTNLNELFYLIRKELAKQDPVIADIEPEYLPTRAEDLPDTLADISKAADILKFFPSYTLEDALKILCVC